METLKSVVNSMAATALGSEHRHCNRRHQSCVQRGAADNCFINTAGMGRFRRCRWGAQTLSVGDVLLVSGTLGDHGHYPQPA